LLPPKHLDFTRLFYQWAVPGRPDALFPFSWRTKELAPIAGEAIRQAAHASLSHQAQGQNPTPQHFDTLLS
jgi:hypothetical protein